MNYFTACEYGKKSKEVQVAVLLNVAGAEAQDVHEHFQLMQKLKLLIRKTMPNSWICLVIIVAPGRMLFMNGTDFGVGTKVVMNMLITG